MITLLYILLAYFALRFILRMAKPFLIRYFVNRMGKKFETQFGANPFENVSPSQKNNNSNTKPPKKVSKKVVGEYIDFEEID